MTRAQTSDKNRSFDKNFSLDELVSRLKIRGFQDDFSLEAKQARAIQRKVPVLYFFVLSQPTKQARSEIEDRKISCLSFTASLSI